MKISQFFLLSFIIVCVLKPMEQGAETATYHSNASALMQSLMEAVEKNDKTRIKELVKLGANPNLPGLNPLIHAFYTNDLDLVQFLLHHRASLDQWTPNPAWGTVGGYLENPLKPVSQEIKDYIASWRNLSGMGSSSIGSKTTERGHEGGM